MQKRTLPISFTMKQFLSFAVVFFNASTLRPPSDATPGPKLIATTPPSSNKVSSLRSPLVCSGHGSFTCKCDKGYTGANCDTEIDFCKQPVPFMNSPFVTVADICKPNGVCQSTTEGAQCICQPGYAGQFCQTEIPDQIWTSGRCALYDTNQISSTNITIGCPVGQHCVPDNMNCVVTETCDDPSGWCLPLANVRKVAEYFNRLLRE